MCRTGCREACSMIWGLMYLFTGLCLICMGTWMLMDYHVYDVTVMYKYEFMNDNTLWLGATWGTVGLGCYCTIIGTMGMIGIGCVSRGATVAFLILGSLGALGCALIGSLAAFYYTESSYQDIQFTMLENLQKYYVVDSTDDFSAAWDRTQVMGECCGLSNSYDYKQSVFINKTDGYPDVPWTCCIMEERYPYNIEEGYIVNKHLCYEEADTVGSKYDYLNTMGCTEILINRFKYYQATLLGASWCSCGLQFLSIIIIGCSTKPLTAYSRTRKDTY